MSSNASSPPLLELDGLEVRLAGRPILKGLNGSLTGQVVGLLGPNGAGKTTLFNAILGFYRPHSGRATVLGRDIVDDAAALRSRIGYMPESDSFVSGMSGVRFVRMMAELAGLPPEPALERAHEALFYVGLGEARYRKLDTYSLGMKQLAKLAQAIAHGPKLLLLDEPTNGLDPSARQRMLSLVREIAASGVRIILSSHLLRDVETCCDSVIVLKDGKVATIANLAEERRGDRKYLEIEIRSENGDGKNGDGLFPRALAELGCEVAELAEPEAQGGAAGVGRRQGALPDRRRAGCSAPPPDLEPQLARAPVPEGDGREGGAPCQEAVYDRRYRGYTGERTGARFRYWTVARFALQDLFKSRLALILLIAACLPPLFFAGMIYIANNLEMLTAIGWKVSGEGVDSSWIAIDKEPFFWFLVWQSAFSFFLASFIGPTLVAPDLANNALPLYLSRPLKRSDYIIGKLLVLLLPLSAVTWIAGLLLVTLQTSLAGFGWLTTNWRIVPAVFFGSWIWILLLSLLALAVSAWVKWRMVATGMLFGIFMVGEAFGHAIVQIAGVRWGKLLAFDDLVQTIWARLFGGIDFFGGPFPEDPLPVVACWAMLAAISAASLWILHVKVRACEVSRS